MCWPTPTAEAISRAVRCGVRTIEHGNLVDAEAARLMAGQGAYVVPTLITYEALANEADLGLPADSVAKVAQVRNAGLHSLEIYRDAGVPMGFGTDLLGPSHRLQSEIPPARRGVGRGQGAYVVPTLITYEALANEGADLGLPADSVAKVAQVRNAGLHSLEIYRDAGVPMGFGTDLLGPSHRLQSEEFRLRAEVLGAPAVIASATQVARGCWAWRASWASSRRAPAPTCWWWTAIRCATCPACWGRASTSRW